MVSLLGLLNHKPVETTLISAFLKNNSASCDFSAVKTLFLKSSSKINIIFSANDKESLNKTLDDFSLELDNLIKSDKKNDKIAAVLDFYKNSSQNYLSEKNKILIKQKNYKKLKQDSLELLYNPLGIYILEPDKDPYLLLTDFILENKKIRKDVVEYNNKFYSILNFEVNTEDVKKIINLKNSILNENPEVEIYLSGTPVHSYIISRKSKIEINVFCAISTLALILLCLYFFKSIKILFPIGFSILFGFLSGYGFCNLFFNSIHVLTFVFSTTLIGVGLDYSLHYFADGNNANFKKSLTCSITTTVLAFLLLFLSSVEILKQITVFTSFGLFGTYLFVLFILPLFNFKCGFRPLGTFKINKIAKYSIFLITTIVIIFGLFKINFNDNLKNLYQPKGDLLKAEKINSEVFNTNPEFIFVKGNSISEILAREDEITKILDNKKIDYISLNKFNLSDNKQKENYDLISKLYKNDLNNNSFLDKKTIETLKNKPYKSADVENFPLNDDFMVDKNTSFIFLFNSEKDLQNQPFKTIKIQNELNNLIKIARLNCLKVLPIVFFAIFIFLFINFKLKSAKIIAPSLISTLFTIGLLSIFGQSINLFHILALFLVIGFSLDYSIFRAKGGKNSSSAVLISASSSAFSFMLLSFTSFKLISSLGVVLFFGILTSYIFSLLLIDEADKKDEARENI